jgi:hypothetical protein
MTRYCKAKQQFLSWISTQAEDQGIELTIDHSNRLYHREPDVLARLRATEKQRRFQTRNTDDELSVSREITNRFNRILCVLLQLTSPTEFNPQTDHFYPLRISEIRRHTGEKHASGEYQLNFDFTSSTADRARDDVEFALGLQRTINNTQTGPSESSPLQEIARDVCREFEKKND